MHRNNLDGGPSERNHKAYWNGLVLQEIKFFKCNPYIAAEKSSGIFQMLKTTKSFEPLRYRHAWPIHRAHQKDGILCVG